eukprot:3988051-Pleurochrysis_carterae.AAC.1
MRRVTPRLDLPHKKDAEQQGLIRCRPGCSMAAHGERATLQRRGGRSAARATRHTSGQIRSQISFVEFECRR